MNIFNLMQQFQSNPIAMLQQRFNIPSDITTPNDILQHLVNSGQVTQQQLNQVMHMSRMFRK